SQQFTRARSGHDQLFDGPNPKPDGRFTPQHVAERSYDCAATVIAASSTIWQHHDVRLSGLFVVPLSTSAPGTQVFRWLHSHGRLHVLQNHGSDRLPE